MRKFAANRLRKLVGALAGVFFGLAIVLATSSGQAQTATRGGTASAPATTKAATGPASTEPDEDLPREVHVGVFVNQIKDIDLKTNTFVVDFWLWFRWKSDSIKPHETFEIIGGHVESREN